MHTKFAQIRKKLETRSAKLVALGGTTLLAFGLMGVAIAWATIPSDGGQVNTCYSKATGQVRVVSAPNTCKPTEKPLSLQEFRSPPSVVVRRGTEVIVPMGGNASTTAQCRPGELAVGGGYNSGDFGLFVVTSQPIRTDGEFARDGETPTGWSFFVTNTRSVNLGFLPTVTCLNPAPA
jgi:hypothetical protein